MSKWRVTLRTPSGEPLIYHKDYPKKGVGLVIDMRSGRYLWEVLIEPDMVLMDIGYVGSLEEGKKILDDYFELVDEYE